MCVSFVLLHACPEPWARCTGPHCVCGLRALLLQRYSAPHRRIRATARPSTRPAVTTVSCPTSASTATPWWARGHAAVEQTESGRELHLYAKVRILFIPCCLTVLISFSIIWEKDQQIIVSSISIFILEQYF